MSVAIDIRYQVFCVEENIDYRLEMDLDEEKRSISYLIYLKDKVIGTIRYLIDDKGIKIQRFAILKEYRGKGYGTEIFKYFSEMLAKRYNPVTLYIHAQYHLKSMYEKLGYIVDGEPFMEAGLKHILMKKRCE